MRGFKWGIAAIAVLALVASASAAWRSWRRSSEIDAVRLALRTAEPDVALKKLEPLEASARRSAQISYLLAVANRRAGHTVKAREFLSDARRLGWSPNEIKLQEFLLQFQSGDVDTAEQRLLSVVGPNCPNEQAAEIYECLAMGYLSAMRVGEARMALDYWLAWDPESIPAHLLLADIFRTTHDRVREVAAYEAILKADPNHLRARRLLADAYLEVKDISAALKNYQRCAELAPDDPTLLISIATCQRRLGDTAKARQLLDEALRGDLPDRHRSLALTELGQLAVNDKEYEQAVRYLEEATALAPINSSAHYALGLALSRVGRRKEADEHIERSQKMDEEAIRYIDLVNEIMRESDDPGLRCRAGEMALDSGARKEALAWFQSALRSDPAHAPTHEALAHYYREAGHQELAQRHLEFVAGKEASPSNEAD